MFYFLGQPRPVTERTECEASREEEPHDWVGEVQRMWSRGDGTNEDWSGHR